MQARYQQVKTHLAEGLHSGHWQVGDRLPSEHELVAQFGLSRMTVNRAVRELADEGRIVRVAGVGSFVAEQKPQSTLLHIADLAGEVTARGHDYRCELLQLARVAANLEVATALALDTSESVFHALCVHYENALPVQLEERYVNPHIAPDFISQDFSREQPSAYLLRTVPYDDIEHIVDAVLPTAAQAKRLKMDATEPCLLLTRRTWTQGTAVTLVRCLHPAHRYRLGSRHQT
jgi:GntR family transcriptional regulator, histidine utilization repressor